MLKVILVVFSLSLSSTLGKYYDIQADIELAVVAACNVFQQSGIICSDCETLSRCVLNNNQWQSYDVDKCDNRAGIYCNSFEQQCSNSAGPCNPLIDFGCSEEGFFPNPFSCQQYYSCVRGSDAAEIVAFPRTCPIGMAYSPATKSCTLTIQDSVCQALQWQCSYPGDMGLWPGSDDIFYLCLRNPDTDTLIPELHKCIMDQIFDGSNCVDRNGGSQTTTESTGTTTDSNSGSSSSDVSTDTTTSQSPTFVCSAPGIFENVNNCRQYFYCDSGLNYILYDCPNGTHFVPGTSACAWGQC